MAVTRYQPEAMIIQAHRALEYLPPGNLRFRFTANWVLSIAYYFQGDRAAASRAYSGSLIDQPGVCEYVFHDTGDQPPGAATGNGEPALSGGRDLSACAATGGRSAGPSANEAYLGLARICYEWNDLDAAEQHGQQSLQLARQYDRVLDRFIICEVFLARLKLAQGDVAGAAAMLAETEQSVRQKNFVQRMPEVAAAQVLTLLRQGNVAAAAHLAQTHDLPLSQARVFLAQGDPSAALAVLEPLRRQMEAKGWQDERLKVMVLQAVAARVRMAKRTRPCNCWVRRWRWPSRAASSGSLWTKASRCDC